MRADEKRHESNEEFIARIAARHKARLEARKPKVTLTVSPQVVEAVKANPESVKVAVKAPNDVGLIERARPIEVVQVLEVDQFGRPKLIQRYDCATGDHSLIEMAGGYRAPAGVRHEYNPMEGLRRPGDE